MEEAAASATKRWQGLKWGLQQQKRACVLCNGKATNTEIMNQQGVRLREEAAEARLTKIIAEQKANQAKKRVKRVSNQKSEIEQNGVMR